MHKTVEIKAPQKFETPTKLKLTFIALAALGALAFVFLLFKDPTRAWQSYLLGTVYFVSVALIGLFFIAIHFLTQSGWSVNVRRLFEATAAYIPVAAVLTLILMLFGVGYLFSWLNPEVVAKDSLLLHKQGYLNPTFFWIRFIVFFGGWILFNHFIVNGTRKQDQTGDKSLVKAIVPKSVGYIMFFALSFSFFAVDFLMSLEPHWFSTIFGIYLFGGASQTFFAMMIIATIFLIKRGYYNGMVNENHIHDMAKYMLGFTVFWAYIAFSQFMLIWYANLPEETIFFVHRMEGPWAVMSVALIILKFVIPFLALLPRWAKRDMNYIRIICGLIIITQFLDLHWLIYPNFDDHAVQLNGFDVAVFLGFLGIFGLTFTNYLSKNSLIPMNDPYIEESAAHEVVYH
ncbi:MAG: molybdopterin oxidoreductase [Bdellovibrionaceae bacterium]|nr:molybdopterin oxidoreductase [Pseudobdellovibrionaceae bacterium]